MNSNFDVQFGEVDTPALLLDETKVRSNVDEMQSLVNAAGISLRPHAKAHKCSTLARLQREAGAVGICCAKVGEAEAMVQGGQDDILLTTPIVGDIKIARLIALAHVASISVVADDMANLVELNTAALAAQVRIGVVIEVDVGQGRCGVPPGPHAALLLQQVLLLPALQLVGVQAYQGRLQCLPSYEVRRNAVVDAMAALRLSLDAAHEMGLSMPVITGGGTGSVPIDIELKMLNELQPGSYITMDAAYAVTEWSADRSLTPFGQPLLVLASVVSRPSADRAVIDVGWKSISSDGGTPSVFGRSNLRFEFGGDEHGIIRAVQGDVNLALGERLCLVPTHCDTTVNLYDRFAVHHAGRLQAYWAIEGRGKSQ
jgi:3-hydroxy-D-aspartate aldolase